MFQISVLSDLNNRTSTISVKDDNGRCFGTWTFITKPVLLNKINDATGFYEGYRNTMNILYKTLSEAGISTTPDNPFDESPYSLQPFWETLEIGNLILKPKGP